VQYQLDHAAAVTGKMQALAGALDSLKPRMVHDCSLGRPKFAVASVCSIDFECATVGWAVGCSLEPETLVSELLFLPEATILENFLHSVGE